MAILIPGMLVEAGEVTEGDRRVARDLATGWPNDVSIWHHPSADSSRPRFVAISPGHGIIGIDVCDWIPGEVRVVSGARVSAASRTVDPIGDLGRRIEALRQLLQGLHPEPPLRGLVALPHFTREQIREAGLDRYFPPGTALGAHELSTALTNGNLKTPPDSLTPEVLEEIRRRLYPETLFERPRLLVDEGKGKRVIIRLELDQEQECMARSLSSGVTLLTGVSGSGKSLVLCARARVLAMEHPDWEIQILCFNRTLVEYLRELVGEDVVNVRIDTFHRWANELGIRIPWDRDEDSRAQMVKTVKQAVREKTGVATCDAMLIDEAQDFDPSWLALAFAAVRPKQGGIVVASDMAQAIYQGQSPAWIFSKLKVTTVVLHRNYRNTRQIGEFAYGAVFGSPEQLGESGEPSLIPARPEFVTEGEAVQMVWGERWDHQAEIVGKEIRRLVDSGRAQYRDIAVLYTMRAGMVKRLLAALEAETVPHFWVNRDRSSKSALDLSENTVKLMTVHAAKGFEFSIVFLFGIEALKVPESLDVTDREGANRTRLAYVGMTRAQDLLYVTYTRSNPVIDRALKLKEWCEFRSYPDDFDFD